jgi:hypothetical protein
MQNTNPQVDPNNPQPTPGQSRREHAAPESIGWSLFQGLAPILGRNPHTIESAAKANSVRGAFSDATLVRPAVMFGTNDSVIVLGPRCPGGPDTSLPR